MITSAESRVVRTVDRVLLRSDQRTLDARNCYFHNGNMPKRKRVLGRLSSRKSADLAAEATELIAYLDRAMRQLVLAGEDRDASMRFRHSEIAVIDTLGAEGPLVMGQMARRLQLPLSTATRVVDRLVELRVVQRERLGDNRRVVQVGLAPIGLKFYRGALRGRIAGAQRMLERLDKSERRELVRLILKIAESTSAVPNE